MLNNNRNDLMLLSELLIQIRGIAGDAAHMGHISAMGHGHFTEADALNAIYKLADAAHNVPAALADGPGAGAHFLLDGARERIAVIGAEVFGDRSTFTAFLPEPTL